ARRTALSLVPHDEWAGLYDAPSAMFVFGPTALDPHFTPFQGALRGDVDVGAMATATRDLLAPIRAANLSTFAGQPASLTASTPRCGTSRCGGRGTTRAATRGGTRRWC